MPTEREIEAAAEAIMGHAWDVSLTDARRCASAALEAAERERWQLKIPKLRCDECDNGIEQDWLYCPYCGDRAKAALEAGKEGE